MDINWGKLFEIAQPWIKAIVTVILGFLVVSYIVKLIKKTLEKKKTDASMISFVGKTIKILLDTFIVLSALSMVGISTTGLVAALSAAVVAIGLALKDSLGNIAGGVLLLISPRFYTGDFIEAAGKSGNVIKVDLLHTTLKTPDNRIVSVPNGTLVNSDIINYSQETKRRVDIEFDIPFEADCELAKKVISEKIENHPLVLDEPDKPFVRVVRYGESSVQIVTRSWCESADYWTVYFDIMEQVRASLEENGIEMPYKRVDVTIKN